MFFEAANQSIKIKFMCFELILEIIQSFFFMKYITFANNEIRGLKIDCFRHISS